MNHYLLKVLSMLLVLCVLSIGGLAQAESVEHAGHHAHHQAATHGTVLCSWMCAVGQGWEAVVAPTPHELAPIELHELATIGGLPVHHESAPTTRGPPLR
ncbi:MAG: hypothetical protein FJ247_03750 [Nitrospira sp.]|nr:hypothetical protein [Nitrospira sp.]